MSLASRVKSRRLALEMTQTEAAEKAGIKQQSWASIEDGKTVKPRNIIAIGAALQCDPGWLMTGDNIQPISEVNTRKIPLISYVQAGNLAESIPISDCDGSFEYVLTDQELSHNAFALRIEGDSMEPDFKTGDVVIIDPEIEPHPGEFVVASNGEQEATFKKYRPTHVMINGDQHYELVPLNDDYPVLDSEKINLRIIGTMVEHRIYRRKR
ncbi:LexA family protein [Morganella morganii]|uniref:LexA family protein n=1 Tax=Morganella morganii TaxID=582 RepID=UPI000538BE90|nr:LexA family transcriptional regulator [Morganella morganii]AUT98733.1 helix-turn-helix domain-containing protein [Morganella morganii]RTY24588.1 helix-turn-helix domain-containing protein [Morganella morganii subsp. morganii]HDU8432049.1 helix-turn-helix domain-containing protein [Morganella morganii]